MAQQNQTGRGTATTVRGPTQTEQRVSRGETFKIGLITYGPKPPAGARDVVKDGDGYSWRQPK